MVRKPPAWNASRGMNDMPIMMQKIASEAEAAGAQHGLVGDATHVFHGPFPRPQIDDRQV